MGRDLSLGQFKIKPLSIFFCILWTLSQGASAEPFVLFQAPSISNEESSFFPDQNLELPSTTTPSESPTPDISNFVKVLEDAINAEVTERVLDIFVYGFLHIIEQQRAQDAIKEIMSTQEESKFPVHRIRLIRIEQLENAQEQSQAEETISLLKALHDLTTTELLTNPDSNPSFGENNGIEPSSEVYERRKRDLEQEAMTEKLKSMSPGAKEALVDKLRENVRARRRKRSIENGLTENSEVERQERKDEEPMMTADVVEERKERNPEENDGETTTAKPGLLGGLLGGLGGSLDFLLSGGKHDINNPGLLGKLLGGIGGSVDGVFKPKDDKENKDDKRDVMSGVDNTMDSEPMMTADVVEERKERNPEENDGEKTTTEKPGLLGGLLGGLGGTLDFLLTGGKNDVNNPGVLGKLLGGIGGHVDGALSGGGKPKEKEKKDDKRDAQEETSAVDNTMGSETMLNTADATEERKERNPEENDGETTTAKPGLLGGLLGGLGGSLDFLLSGGKHDINNPGILGKLLGGIGGSVDGALTGGGNPKDTKEKDDKDKRSNEEDGVMMFNERHEAVAGAAASSGGFGFADENEGERKKSTDESGAMYNERRWAFKRNPEVAAPMYNLERHAAAAGNRLRRSLSNQNKGGKNTILREKRSFNKENNENTLEGRNPLQPFPIGFQEHRNKRFLGFFEPVEPENKTKVKQEDNDKPSFMRTLSSSLLKGAFNGSMIASVGRAIGKTMDASSGLKGNKASENAIGSIGDVADKWLFGAENKLIKHASNTTFHYAVDGKIPTKSKGDLIGSIFKGVGDGAAEGALGYNIGKSIGTSIDAMLWGKDDGKGLFADALSEIGNSSDISSEGKKNNYIAKEAAQGVVDASMDHFLETL